MYFYLVNPAAGRRKLAGVETKLIKDLKRHDILGDWAKTTGRDDVATLVKAAIKRGFTTLVAVGGDGTVSEAINDLADHNAVLGIIPLGSTNQTAKLLGIKNHRVAPQILSARRLETIELAQINGESSRYFIAEAALEGPIKLNLTIDDSFSLRGEFKSGLIKRRFGTPEFEVTLTSVGGGNTSFTARHIKSDKAVKAMLDNEAYEGMVDLSLSPQSLRIIVGKDRHI